MHKISREKLPIKRVGVKNPDTFEKSMVDGEDQSNALNGSLSKVENMGGDVMDEDDLRESECDTCKGKGKFVWIII